MLEQKIIFWTILGMALVSYLPRFLPILFLSGRSLHPLLVSWLRLVPAAVLAAMLAPSLLLKDDKLAFGFDNIFLWVAVIVFPLAWRSKSLSLSVFVGMGLVALGRYLGLAD